MRSKVILLLLICFQLTAQAQLRTPTPGIKMPPNGGSVRGLTGEIVGITDIYINYGRPAVKGREGKIWGGVVKEGFYKNPFFNNKIPWRAGANENTTIEFSTDVYIEGEKLSAGKYGLHIAYGEDESVIVFSNNYESWGSFYYQEKNDALRVKVKPVKKDHSTERLTYTFSDQTDSSATISLVWEKMAIPFKVSTELQQLQVASIEEIMNGVRSFDPQTYRQAADYYNKKNIHLKKALNYANVASRSFKSFYTRYLKYQILEKLERHDEADSIINNAIDLATDRELKTYGYVLLRNKHYDKALLIFKKSYKKDPNNYSNMFGMAKTYAALGNNKTGIKFAKKAKKKAPNEKKKKEIDLLISKLEKANA